MIDWSAGRGFLSAGGKRLEWAAWGAPGPGPAIVLLHEGLGCVALWRDFPQALAQATGCGVFAFSRAGYGQSDPCVLPRPLDYMTREAVEVLPDVLDALGAERVVLVGHSDGATIAAEYAGRVRDARLQGTVLMAPHFFAEEIGLAEIARAGAAYREGDLRGKLARYHADVDCAFHGWNTAWLDPGFKLWNVAAVLERIEVPVLALQGDRDEYGTSAQLDEIARRCNAPSTCVLLDDCGHAPQFEQPESVLKAIAEFTREIR